MFHFPKGQVAVVARSPVLPREQYPGQTPSQGLHEVSPVFVMENLPFCYDQRERELKSCCFHLKFSLKKNSSVRHLA